MYKILLACMFSLSITLAFSALAKAHTGENLIPGEYPIYEQLSGDSSWVWGEIRFFSYEDRIPTSELTNLDRYILGGGKDPASGKNYTSWMNQTLMFISQYYDKFGEIPQSISPETLRSMNPGVAIPQEFLSLMMNPFTDGPVNLQATTPSPGNMYVKEMSKEEIIALSFVSPAYKRKFGLNLDSNPSAGGEITIMPEIQDPVLYFRIYGSNGVLISSVYYRRTSGSDSQ